MVSQFQRMLKLIMGMFLNQNKARNLLSDLDLYQDYVRMVLKMLLVLNCCSPATKL